MERSELPHSEQEALNLRQYAHDRRVINVRLNSVGDAPLAVSLARLRAALPQHSFAFYAPAPSEGFPKLPSAVREAYTVVTWPMLHPQLAAEVQASAAADAGVGVDTAASDANRTIEASAIRRGYTPQPGLTPEQRLRLAKVPFRDEAAAVLHMQAAAAARHIAAVAGGNVRDAKRVRRSDFHRGAGVITVKDHACFGEHTIC
jgi:hypothetical protein